MRRSKLSGAHKAFGRVGEAWERSWYSIGMHRMAFFMLLTGFCTGQQDHSSYLNTKGYLFLR